MTTSHPATQLLEAFFASASEHHLKALIIVSVLGAGLAQVIFAISFSLIAGSARISRGVTLSVKENVYVDAARVIGVSPLRIMLRHILPNAASVYLILASWPWAALS